MSLFDEVNAKLHCGETPKQFICNSEIVSVYTIPADAILAINDSYQRECEKLAAADIASMQMINKVHAG